MDIPSEHPHWNQLIEQMGKLARDRFAARAAGYDEAATFPKENFDDLAEAGLLAPLVDSEYGGFGLATEPGGVFAQWMLTKQLAHADMAMARCWEGHLNAQLLLQKIGTAVQKERWFSGIVNEGQIWASWSGEPQSKKPGETSKFGTNVSKVPGGYIVRGTKIFCSGAAGADWAILFVSLDGPGGARHISSGPESLLMLACDLSDDTVSFDDEWWDPIGMRASVSYLVKFDDTFIPDENLVGYPGQFLIEDWQTRLTPQYATTFLGGAEAAYDHTLEYIKLRGSQDDPYIQHRVAKMKMNLDTCHLWLQRTAGFWESGDQAAAKQSGNNVRYILEQHSMEIVNHAVHICGARSLIRPSKLERIYRDLSFYVRHDNDDLLLASIGKSVLGIGHNQSFFTEQKSDHREA